jgi:phage baseplate assembly protein W
MENDQIGRGILCPFRRDGKGDFANSGGLDVLRSDVGELLGVQAATQTEPGELAWDMDRGSNFLPLKHRGLHSTMLEALADQSASSAIIKYEPRARVIRVQTTTEEETLRCHVTYQPLGYLRSDEQTVSARIR